MTACALSDGTLTRLDQLIEPYSLDTGMLEPGTLDVVGRKIDRSVRGVWYQFLTYVFVKEYTLASRYFVSLARDAIATRNYIQIQQLTPLEPAGPKLKDLFKRALQVKDASGGFPFARHLLGKQCAEGERIFGDGELQEAAQKRRDLTVLLRLYDSAPWLGRLVVAVPGYGAAVRDLMHPTIHLLLRLQKATTLSDVLPFLTGENGERIPRIMRVWQSLAELHAENMATHGPAHEPAFISITAGTLARLKSSSIDTAFIPIYVSQALRKFAIAIDPDDIARERMAARITAELAVDLCDREINKRGVYQLVYDVLVGLEEGHDISFQIDDMDLSRAVGSGLYRVMRDALRVQFDDRRLCDGAIVIGAGRYLDSCLKDQKEPLGVISGMCTQVFQRSLCSKLRPYMRDAQIAIVKARARHGIRL